MDPDMEKKKVSVTVFGVDRHVFAASMTFFFVALLLLHRLLLWISACVCISHMGIYGFAALYTVVQIVTLGALVQAYRHIGGIGYMIWFAFVLLEFLLFLPKDLVCYVTSGWENPLCFSLGWFHSVRYLLYPVLFLVGLYMTRDRQIAWPSLE